MAVEISLGNIVVRPRNEITLTRVTSDEAETIGKMLWGNLFKELSKLDTTVLAARGKRIGKIDTTVREPAESRISIPYVKEVKMTSSNRVLCCRYCPHSEDVGVHVKRGDHFELEIVFNRAWDNFDNLSLHLIDTDSQEECKLSLNLTEIENQNDKNAENWKCQILLKDEKRIKIDVSAPISTMPGLWHLLFTLSSSQSQAVLHNFVVSGLQIV